MFAKIEITSTDPSDHAKALGLKDKISKHFTSLGIQHALTINVGNAPRRPPKARRQTRTLGESKLHPKGFGGNFCEVDRRIIELRNDKHSDLEIAVELGRHFGGAWLPTHVRARINEMVR